LKQSGGDAQFEIESATSINGPWSHQDAIISRPMGGQYTVAINSSGASRFYRVAVN
jgi:hypothetical protein